MKAMKTKVMIFERENSMTGGQLNITIEDEGVEQGRDFVCKII